MPRQAEETGFGSLRIFSGEPQDDNFANLKNLVKVKEMRPSSRPFEFSTGPAIALPKTYEVNGVSKELKRLLEETHTVALFVLKDGAVRFEDYASTGGRKTQWISMSVAKSFTSALVGIALAEGRIGSLEDPIDKYVPKLSRSAYDGVRIKDVLQMSSGARWYEDYSDPKSDIFRLRVAWERGGSLDDFVASLPREKPPGTVCKYDSADTQALGMLLVSVTGKSIGDYMQEKLCEPLGMESSSYWLIDDRGRELAFGGLLMTARDFAKLGELYRNGGVWSGKQVVPAHYVAASTRADAPHLAPGKPIIADHTLPLGYGYQWWLPEGDRGEFTGIGVYNQFVYVDPSRGVVIVKLSANPAYGTTADEETNLDFHNVCALRAISGQLD
ncbi:MAG TPA: serine hydrolase [Candidatus Binataceae bacterium]|nr:serine hydrolase [Candidatus Binataceae bacterium]